MNKVRHSNVSTRSIGGRTNVPGAFWAAGSIKHEGGKGRGGTKEGGVVLRKTTNSQKKLEEIARGGGEKKFNREGGSHSSTEMVQEFAKRVKVEGPWFGNEYFGRD